MEKLKFIKFTAGARELLEEEVRNKCITRAIDVKRTAGKWFVLYITVRYIEINNIIIDGRCFGKKADRYEEYLFLNRLMGNILSEDDFMETYPYISLGGSIDRRFYEFLSEGYFGEPEVIGWMYQYYMSAEKERVFKALHENIKVSRDDIPYATQLFTPKWIGQYLVQNSLGRKLLRGGLESLKKDWMYYIEDENCNLEKENDFDIEKIKFIDPCMGTGNIILHAFDIFYNAYLYLGYDEGEITRLIFKNNLYGLDIDEDAVAVGRFCLALKSAGYNGNNIYSSDMEILEDRMAAIKDSADLCIEAEKLSCDEDIQKSLLYLVDMFKNGAEYGTTLNVDREKAERTLELAYGKDNISDCLRRMIIGADILSEKYDVVVTNPPYLGIRGINEEFASYLSENYSLSKHDLCTVYMERAYSMLKDGGIYAMINQHSWMFLTSFEKLREKIIKQWSIISLLHLGTKAFEENVGTIVQSAAFVVEKSRNISGNTTAIDLRDGGCLEKERCFLEVLGGKREEKIYRRNLRCFLAMPRKPLAYWIDENALSAFEKCTPLESVAKPRQGMASSDNRRFVRYWYEVRKKDICFGAAGRKEALNSGKRWFPYRKGGKFRKWYGNNSFVIDWKDNGREVKEYAASMYTTYTRTIKNEELYFKKCLTYTFISEDLGIRYSEPGFIFDVAGSSIFIDDYKREMVLLGFLCSSTAGYFLEVMNPTYNIQVGDLKNIPVDERMFDSRYADRIVGLVEENIELSREEWDDYEESWNFTCHPYIKYRNSKASKLEDCAGSWEEYSKRRFERIKENEEELNRIFADIYGLSGIVVTEMPDYKITVRRAELREDAVSFLSYACGCIFGRFKCPGFESELKGNVAVMSDVRSDFDFYSLIKQFLAEVFGQENLESNLEFIASAFTAWQDKSVEERIRRYLDVSFYKDHLKRYNGRPIYWLFSSGKNKSFEALMYYHNYSGGEFERIGGYLLPEAKDYYENRIKESLDDVKYSGKKMNKRQQSRIEEYYECLAELNEYRNRIEAKKGRIPMLDIDDGIEENYILFQGDEAVLKDISKKKYI